MQEKKNNFADIALIYYYSKYKISYLTREFMLKFNPFTHKKLNNFIVFDIGTSKISAISANITKQGLAEIKHNIIQESNGFSAGGIANLELAEASIINAVYELEKECNKSIREAAISISGSGIKSYYVNQTLKLGSQPISKLHIKKLLHKAASNFNVPDKEAIHYFPIEFILDKEHIVENPVGLYAKELTCQVHIVAASSLTITNLINCLAKCHIEVSDVILSIYASGLSCISEEEKKLGAIIIDIGHLTSSFAVFLEGNIIYSGYVPLGSQHITADIAKTFSINLSTAEKLKHLYGSAIIDKQNMHKIIRLDDFEPNIGYHAYSTITLSKLSEVINIRMSEILNKIYNECNSLAVDHLIAKRVILTGSGSLLKNIKEFTASIFNKNVRIATPEIPNGFTSPKDAYQYDVAIGMVKSKIEQYQKNYTYEINHHKGGMFNKMLYWFNEKG